MGVLSPSVFTAMLQIQRAEGAVVRRAAGGAAGEGLSIRAVALRGRRLQRMWCVHSMQQCVSQPRCKPLVSRPATAISRGVTSLYRIH